MTIKYRLSEPVCDEKELRLLAECVQTKTIGSGQKYVGLLEERFAKLHGCDRGLAVQSGTAALHTALYGLGIPAGANVAVPDFTCAATGAAVRMAGGHVELVDVEPITIGMDFQKLKAAHAVRPLWGVILVHMYGVPARNSEDIIEWCKQNSIKLVEDCCEAHGARYASGHMVGSMGDVACFSLRSEKLIGVGEGGILITKDRDVMQRSRFFANRAKPRDGWVWKYYTADIGFNYPMPNLLAAFGYAQLDRLLGFINRRREIGKMYRELLPWLHWQDMSKDSVYWLNFGRFPIKITDDETSMRDQMEETGMSLIVRKVGEALMERGVEVRPGFFPLRRQPAFTSDYSVDGGAIWESDKLTYSGL